MKVLLFILLFIFSTGSVPKKGWIIYPNPTHARTYFNIECRGCELPPYLKIYETRSGQLIYKEYIGKGLSFKKVDINFGTGTYIVFLRSNDN